MYILSSRKYSNEAKIISEFEPEVKVETLPDTALTGLENADNMREMPSGLNENLANSQAVNTTELPLENKTEVLTDTNITSFDNTGYIPEPPPIFDENIILNAIGEPTLHSLGLASYSSPSGWLQLALEFAHVNMGLPWYGALISLGVVIRILLLPVTVFSQRNAAKMKKLSPMTNKLREKLTEAQLSGDQMKG